jgi:radical SAM superfamily enzyme YgiQ (UPF0313 family)
MNSEPTINLVRPLIREYVNSQSSDSFESSIGLVPPLNLCCLAATVEQAGFKVSIYDCEANENRDDLFATLLAEQKPDIVGISIITTNFRGALQTAKLTRKILPDTTIVCGGTHTMIFAAETMSHPEFDYGFVGEAENSLVEFLTFYKKEVFDPSKVPGLVWRSGEDVIVNEPCGFNENLDSLPFPAYHLLDQSAYQMPNAKGHIISLFLSRGCPFSCGFCFRNPQLRKVRFKSVDRAIEEIGYLVEKHDVRSINFVDETISLKKQYFIEFCEKLIAKGWDLEWQSPTRVTSLDEEIVQAAKKAGCHTFRLGIESGSNEILKKIDKKITIESSQDAVALCRKYGIKTVGYFIIGYVGETEATIRKTIKFAKRIGLDYAAFFPATPMPGTALCTECEEKGLIPKNYWRDYILGKRSDPLPFIFPNAGEWSSIAYRNFYFSTGYILRQMKYRQFYVDIFKNIKIAMNLLHTKFNRDRSIDQH